MSEYELIPPQKSPIVSFATEPVRNALTSLVILNSDLAGFGQWVQDTRESLSAEELLTNRMICDAAVTHLDGGDWPSFPAWVDDMARRDPYAVQRHSLIVFLDRLQTKLELEPEEIPTPEQLVADQSTYLALIKRACEYTGEPCDLSYHTLEHEYLQDPMARHALIVDHLRQMWDKHLAREWQRIQPLIQESVAAFKSMHYGGKTASEIVSEVTARDAIPRDWERWLPEAEQLAFIPSAHIGPYLLLIDRRQGMARIVFGARIPPGTAIVSPTLNRSELLTRLGALADDTRLRILELLAHEGELGAQQVISRLDMSQSSASRHLRQLVATGYVTERRREGAKAYSLNPDRLEETLSYLMQFLRK